MPDASSWEQKTPKYYKLVTQRRQAEDAGGPAGEVWPAVSAGVLETAENVLVAG